MEVRGGGISNAIVTPVSRRHRIKKALEWRKRHIAFSPLDLTPFVVVFLPSPPLSPFSSPFFPNIRAGGGKEKETPRLFEPRGRKGSGQSVRNSAPHRADEEGRDGGGGRTRGEECTQKNFLTCSCDKMARRRRKRRLLNTVFPRPAEGRCGTAWEEQEIDCPMH